MIKPAKSSQTDSQSSSAHAGETCSNQTTGGVAHFTHSKDHVFLFMF